jgi:hypothetical protein
MQALTGLLPGRFLRIPITLVALFGAGFFEAACVSAAPPHKSAAQKQIGKTSITAAELRARVYETAERLGGFVEAAADDIRSKSSDPAAWRNALLWKADGILALYAAAFRPDPFVGALDLWTLVAQMDLYFSEGAGKAAFGAEQSIAQAALGRMSALCEEAGAAIAANPEMLEHWRVEIQKFARAHSVEGSFSTRSTEAAQLAKFEASAGALAAVGRATETLSDITLRLDSYSTLMPKEIRWQGELLASEIAGRENLRSALDDVEAIGRAGKRADEVLSDIPGTVRASTGPIQVLLDRERTEMMAAVDRERMALTTFITSERQAALDAVSKERQESEEC